MEVNSGAVKHVVKLILSVGEVYNTTLTHMRGVDGAEIGISRI